ncbi:DUF3887 domain-containing protein [Oceanobacillus sp. Castelsardo]|uniref:DUF3887 domain-containing protein n=1 Tax=Oceanobacillus sp. Castelsardo TaxID=1851204 RepID=UPI000837CA7F|nr:DUF3887 domain-containing protein [Oceanobacillus sp. Castelsardo]
MKKLTIPFIFILIGILLITGCKSAEKQEEQFQETAEKEANVVFGEEFIMFLSEGNFQKATEYLDSAIKDDLPATKLENKWNKLEEELGNFKKQEYDKTEKIDDYDVIYINGQFEKGNAYFQIKLNQNEKITSFEIS